MRTTEELNNNNFRKKDKKNKRFYSIKEIKVNLS